MNNMPKICLIWILLALVGIFLVKPIQSLPPLHPPVLYNRDHALFEKLNTFANDDKEKYLNYRLPNETYPELYDITLTTNVHTGEKAFKGEVTIDIVVAKTTSNIVLHARQLNITKVTIKNPSSGATEILSYKYEPEREFLNLTRQNNKNAFAKNTKWKLTIVYNGTLREDNGGFYLSKYTDDAGKTRYLATTQFESTNARHAFPCYDEPNKRANFTITIHHSPTYKAISNMPVNEALSSAGKTVFLTTARIPTYIVAFIVSDFESTEGVLNNLPQRVYSRPSTKNKQEWALVSAMLITERLSKYFDLEFMLPKIDHVAVPDFAAGAMENWGLVTYREEYLLFDKNTSTVFTQTSIADIIAHELCHQWFGDLVTMDWWMTLWLKEGFATMFSYKAVDGAYPEWGIWQLFYTDDYQTALILDGMDNPRPMTFYVEKPSDIASLYDYVSYPKAGSVLRMWNNALTDRVFHQGLHNYLTTNQYNGAVEEHLFTAIQTAAKEENFSIPATISEMMSTWTRQGGYPMLTITRNYDEGTFIVRQTAFHHNKTLRDDKTWFVPINYVVASNPDFRDTTATHYLLNVTEMKVDAKIAKKDWLMLNKQSSYYYRIKYDNENYKLITETLIRKPFSIHALNRAQLMHDAYFFSAYDRLDDAILLKMLTYLKKEYQYAPWSTASFILKIYHRYLYGDKEYDDLKFFIADLVVPIYEKLGVDEIPGEQHFDKYTRNVVINLACLAGVKDCLDETNNKLKALVTKNIPIEPDLQTPIYCNGLKQSGDEEFYYFYKQLMDSQDQAFRSMLISVLGCSQNKNHINKFIYSSIDMSNKLRLQERSTLLFPVYSRGDLGLMTCIEFLDENWKDYGELQGGFTGANPLDIDIRKMASYVVNKDQETKLLALVNKVKNSKYVTHSLEMSVKETISNNFVWLNANRNPIMSWVKQYRVDKNKGGSQVVTAAGSAVVSASIKLIAFAFVKTVLGLL